MTYQLLHSFNTHQSFKKVRNKAVLATVVYLKETSYPTPGARVLLQDSGLAVGSIRVECVEKNIQKQVQSVFQINKTKLIKYDGRYRFEIFSPHCPTNKKEHLFEWFIRIENESLLLSKLLELDLDIEIFKQQIRARLKLWMLKVEHDVLQLCKYASLTGWEADIVAPPSEKKQLIDFQGANVIYYIDEGNVSNSIGDRQTAVVLMTHSYVKDLKFLFALCERRRSYIRLLGAKFRKARLLFKLMEHKINTFVNFIERIYGPTGKNNKAEIAKDIALSIIVEIRAIIRKQESIFLKINRCSLHSL